MPMQYIKLDVFMRRRNNKNAKERLETFDCLVKDPTSFRARWSEIFGNENPIHIEIGMGKGQFLKKMAEMNPDINYLGIEKFESVLLQAAKKFPVPLPNLRLIVFDAEKILDCFSEGEISKVYLNFSDPWPKKGHAKRRLTSPNYLKLYSEILSNTKTVEFKTDNRPLFEYSIGSFWSQGWALVKISLDLHKSMDGIITTEYEDKFHGLGQPIYYMEVKHE